jgi:TatD DNase family protein
MSTYTDSHAHIYLEHFDADRKEIVEKCQDQGIGKIYMPNVDSETIDAMLETEFRFKEMCIPMMGLHPCSVKKHFEKELYVVEEWLNKRPFAAVGEIGTDLYWDRSYWPEQQEALRIQLQWALDRKLPVVLHSRESIDETIELVQPFSKQGLKGVFHCFSGTREQASKITDLGFLLGIGGVATFKNGGLDKVLENVPLTHLLLETDSPYLAPVPHRGKRNEPTYIPLIAEKISEITGKDIDTIAYVTTQNALNLFHEIREN